MPEPLLQLWNFLTPLDKSILTFIGGGLLAFAKLAYKAFTNCLPTIQKNTGETRDGVLKLVTIMETRAADGK